MNAKIRSTVLFLSLSILAFTGCRNETVPGPAGSDGQDATVYYSEWITPTEWSGNSGDWYFEASAPDLTENIVENGVILAYIWLGGDLYDGTSVRPLPAYAVDANWSFLVYQYGSIQFTSDLIARPATTGNQFRFIAIPGTTLALKSASIKSYSGEELKKLSYREVCKIYHIPQ